MSKQLKPVALIQTGVANAMEATPLEIDGVLFVETAGNVVQAYDAVTGEELWSYTPALEFSSLCCGPQARGVAVAYGKVYVAQVDGHVVALDAKTGKVVWKTRREDILPQPYHWYTFTGAPQVYNGLVVVGNGGAEWPTRGFVEALDAETGKLVWRFNDTAGPDDPNFKGAWEGDSWKIGGGSMWDAVAVDPKRDLMMFAIGNPNPDLYGDFRKGNNLYTVSMVAVHAKTGKLAWYYQQIPHDVWDLDSAAPTVLFDVLDKNGKMVPAAAEANKNGHLYIVNRDTGKLIRKSRRLRAAERIDHQDDPAGRDGAGLLSGQSWRRDVAAAGLFAADPLFLHHGDQRAAHLQGEAEQALGAGHAGSGPAIRQRRSHRGGAQGAGIPDDSATPAICQRSTSTPARSPGSIPAIT